MNTHPDTQGRTRGGALKAPGPAANDANRAQSRGSYEDDLPLAETITRLPGVESVYRALKSWQEQFAPRHYDDAMMPPAQHESQPHDRGPL